MDLWFWPFGAGTTTTFSYQPGAPLVHNLARFLAFHVTTSLGFRHPAGGAQRHPHPHRRPAGDRRSGRASHRARFDSRSGGSP